MNSSLDGITGSIDGRREFLQGIGIGMLGLGRTASASESSRASVWTSIIDYGAISDGKTNNAKAIQMAIEAMAHRGGGVVYIPPGRFLTGGIVLRSRITLYLEAGAVLLGSQRLEDYEYHPGPPVEADANGRHLIFAQDCEDVEIAGLGTIDGQGAAFWAKRGRAEPAPEDLWRDVIAMDWKAATPRRPSPMLEFASCTNLRIRDITLANPAGWTLRPVACNSVFITRIRIRNPIYAPNADGIDVSCCQNVVISGCDIAAGDDAICLKSENPYGELLPTRNIVVSDCLLTTSSNGFKIGTATNGTFENISFSNSVIYNGDVPFNERVIAGIALEMVDGGVLDGVTISNIRMQNVRTPIFIRLGHRRVNPATCLRNVMIRGINAAGAILTCSITGMPDAKVESITLADVLLRTQERGDKGWGSEVPEVASQYPEARMFGRLPAYGLYVRHAKGIRIKNVEIISETSDPRPAIVCDDVTDLTISGFESTNEAVVKPLILLRDTTQAYLHGSRAPENTRLFVQVVGERSERIVIGTNDYGVSERVFSCTDGAKGDAVSGGHRY
jgi:polygalacturonase